MKIALIGPTNLDLISSFSGISKEDYIFAAKKAGEIIAKYNHELIVVPDRGIAVEGMLAYVEHNGSRITAISPAKGETDYQKRTVRCHENLVHCHEIISDLEWYEQHALICRMSDLMICCGISCGTIAEIAWTKWIEKPLVYVCRDLVTCIPTEIIAEAKVEFIDNISNFDKVLKSYNT